jgi:hypothetical protein
MLTIIFWNVGGLERGQVCARLAHRSSATVLLLAECPQPRMVLAALNPPGRVARYHLLPNPAPPDETRVEVFTRLPPSEWNQLLLDRYYSIFGLVRHNSPELLVCTAHLPSRLHSSEREQDDGLRRLSQAIIEVESGRGHSRTLVVGDFNADPFQYGVYSSSGLHAVPTRLLALQDSRTVSGVAYRFFYNPMWRFFGDSTPGPPGTYFWRSSQHDVRFWYLFDQFLLRPDLLQYFVDHDLDILTSDGQVALSSPRDGRPSRATGSDHFPILLRLNYPGV